MKTANRSLESFQYVVNIIGSTKLGISVEVDQHLGQPGINAGTVLAKQLLDIYHKRLADLFAKCVMIPLKDFTCSIVRGSVGAVHYGQVTNPFIYVGQTTPDAHQIAALFVAEAVEVYGGYSFRDWLSSQSHGEALSRCVANTFCPNQLVGFQTVPAWLNAKNRPDWITRSANSETEPVANGCGVAFLHYLHDVLGKSWPDIVNTPGTSLEAKYQKLTGKKGGYAAMMAVLNKKFPPGTPVADVLAMDSPFTFQR